MAEQDPDLVELKKAQRKALLDRLSYVGLAALAIGIFVLRGWGKVQGQLEEEGMTEVTVSMKSPVEWTYRGKRNGIVCVGSMTRLPFWTNKNESCTGTKVGDGATTR